MTVPYVAFRVLIVSAVGLTVLGGLLLLLLLIRDWKKGTLW